MRLRQRHALLRALASARRARARRRRQVRGSGLVLLLLLLLLLPQLLLLRLGLGVACGDPHQGRRQERPPTVRAHGVGTQARGRWPRP